MKVFAGNSNRHLADAICSYLNVPVGKASVRRFADQEIFVEIQENVRGEDVFVVQSTSFPANDHLMELLINGILKRGGRRDRLEAKIFGGAKTIASFSNVGEQNSTFANQFLRDEGIKVVGSSTGGEFGRKLEYWPVSGRARTYPLTGAETQKTVAQEQRPVRPAKPVESSIEFF